MKIKSSTYEIPSPIRDVDFIFEISNSLNKEFCRNLRKKFDNDDRKYKGVVGSGRLNEDIKQCYDLTLSDKDDYKEEDSILFTALQKGLGKYYEHCLTISDNILDLSLLSNTYHMDDTGYQIQRYEPGGFYVWHQDFRIDPFCGSRQLTYIWYLNSLKDGSGYTEFTCGKKVTPKVGKLVLFPSNWQYIHRAYPSKSKRKYICTGWVHATTHKKGE